eukprot:320907-Ditylum_brightwellii.AAC.2
MQWVVVRTMKQQQDKAILVLRHAYDFKGGGWCKNTSVGGQNGRIYRRNREHDIVRMMRHRKEG